MAIDGYHAFMVIEAPVDRATAESAFYLGGGYKYAMAGEGMGFMHCPRDGERPPAPAGSPSSASLTAPPGSQVGYTRDAMRFMGATFDPSALYRFNAIQRMLKKVLNGRIAAAKVAGLQDRMLEEIAGTTLGEAELLNPPGHGPRARFLAFRDPRPALVRRAFAKNCITDVRGDVIRVGFGLYHDEEDVEAFAALAAEPGLGLEAVASRSLAWAATAPDPAGPRPAQTRKTFMPMIAQERTSVASAPSSRIWPLAVAFSSRAAMRAARSHSECEAVGSTNSASSMIR